MFVIDNDYGHSIISGEKLAFILLKISLIYA